MIELAFIPGAGQAADSALMFLKAGGGLTGAGVTAGVATAGDASDEYVNLANPARTKHILEGDRPGSGGHMWPGSPGKSVFPEDWSGEKIMHEASDVATDPSLTWKQQSGPKVRISQETEHQPDLP
jgi:hypothetical protein